MTLLKVSRSIVFFEHRAPHAVSVRTTSVTPISTDDLYDFSGFCILTLSHVSPGASKRHSHLMHHNIHNIIKVGRINSSQILSRRSSTVALAIVAPDPVTPSSTLLCCWRSRSHVVLRAEVLWIWHGLIAEILKLRLRSRAR